MNAEELREQVIAQLPDAPLVVALGGGADSAVAAWACSRHLPVRAVFVDHALEETLLAAAQTLAEHVALPLTVLSAPVEDGANLESRARDARWQGIRANLAPGEVVVTGHSLDDLAETVLINLLRGAGSRGLAAMSVPRNGVVRPLTGASRTDLRGVAETLGLPFVDDPANSDPRHLRSRIRADLIPLLEREYQPGVRATLGRAASHLAGDDAALQTAARQVPMREDAGALLLPIPVLVTLPRPVAERAVRRTLRRIHPPYAGKASDVDTVFFVAAGGKSHRHARLRGDGFQRRPLRGPLDRSTTGTRRRPPGGVGIDSLRGPPHHRLSVGCRGSGTDLDPGDRPGDLRIRLDRPRRGDG